MKVIIFEDEHHNAERLIRLLGKCDPEIVVETVVESVAEGRKWFAGPHDIDLMLMDIQLSDGNCFELFTGPNVATPVIFTTAYDNFALQAFKVNSVDYLVKPIELSALGNALKKFRQFRPVSQQVDINKLAEAFFKRDTTRFVSRLNNQLVYIKAKDIAYLHSARGLTAATTFSKQEYPLDYSLDQVENQLDKNSFFRVNRQFIIHIDAIKKMTAYYNSRLLVQLNPPTPDDVIISRERVADFKNWLEGKV
jgi:DNA-binding LytR/AlgR family response regulator